VTLRLSTTSRAREAAEGRGEATASLPERGSPLNCLSREFGRREKVGNEKCTTLTKSVSFPMSELMLTCSYFFHADA
jgi:hypothetical protein